MFLLRVINQAPLWLTVLAVVAVFEVYSVGLVLSAAAHGARAG